MKKCVKQITVLGMVGVMLLKGTGESCDIMLTEKYKLTNVRV